MAETSTGRPGRRLPRQQRPPRVLIAAVVAVLLMGGACTERYRNSAAPGCEQLDTLVLMAQSVPSAQLLPCIAALPAGWAFGEMDIGNGSSRFSLDSDEGGTSALVVTLAPGCNITRATEVASEASGARRFERIESLLEGYAGTRSYVFEGGCVTYGFNFAAEGVDQVNDVRTALGFTTRADVAADVFRTSGGRLRL